MLKVNNRLIILLFLFITMSIGIAVGFVSHDSVARNDIREAMYPS